METVLDAATLLPRHFAELYSDRNVKVVGSVKWIPASSLIQTSGVRIYCTPRSGGANVVSVLPDATYSLAVGGGTDSAVWVKVNRDPAGSPYTLTGADILEAQNLQVKPRENYLQIFYRDANGFVVTHGNHLVLETWTRIGVTRTGGIYDAVVGAPTDPFATHTSIQQAIDDTTEGGRILVLSGTWAVASAQQILDANAAFAWNGKTLTVEGEGYGTVLQNTGSLTRAFTVVSASTGTQQGSGSRILNVQLKGFNQSVQLSGGAAFGMRECSVEVWMTQVTAYAAPTLIGTGTSAENWVHERVVTTTPEFRDVESILNTGYTHSVTRTGSLTTENGNLAHNGAMSLGTSAAPTQTLDVTGDIRTTTGYFRSPVYFAMLTDAGAAQACKVGSLVISNTYGDTASSTDLLVRGTSYLNAVQVAGTINAAHVTGGDISMSGTIQTSGTVQGAYLTATVQVYSPYYTGGSINVTGTIQTSGNIYGSSVFGAVYQA